jgi:hypothetical protein
VPTEGDGDDAALVCRGERSTVLQQPAVTRAKSRPAKGAVAAW